MNTNFFIGFSVVTARPHEGGRAGSGEAVVSQNNLSLDIIRGAGNCPYILLLQSDSFHTFPGISVIYNIYDSLINYFQTRYQNILLIPYGTYF